MPHSKLECAFPPTEKIPATRGLARESTTLKVSDATTSSDEKEVLPCLSRTNKPQGALKDLRYIFQEATGSTREK